MPLQHPSVEPASAGLLGLPGPLLHGLLIVAALGAFVWILSRRAVLLRAAAPDPRSDRPAERLRNLLVIGFGQSRQPRYLVAGVLHILIFAGFLVLLLRSLTLLGAGFVPGFTLPGLSGAAGELYASIKDWFALAVLASCAVAAARRLFVKPARYHDRLAHKPHGAEAYVILGMISVLLLSDALFEGSVLAAERHTTLALPMASAVSALLAGSSTETLDGLRLAGFWVHDVVLLAFACYLPISKHFHVITALPNVYFGKLAPLGRVKPPRHGTKTPAAAAEGAVEPIGVRRLEEFTWKHVLDFYSCTDCGRCSDSCPAYGTGRPLSPRAISVACRDEAYERWPILPRAAASAPPRALLGEVVSEEALWSCTTCGACEETCPVTIEYIDKIVDMRRALVDEGRVPATLQKALADVEKRGNPYGKMPRKRGEWVTAPGGASCGVRVLEPGERAKLLYFTDSATAFDPRLQEIGRAFGALLAAARVDCGTLGKDEVDSGHEVRRIGEEGLFEVLREKNQAALAEREFEAVVTSDPHALNALRNDYGLEKPVKHHTQVLDELLSSGALSLKPLDDSRVHTFHDPCYLGRHNGEYDAPRRVLDAIPGLKRVEMERSRNRSACCGGGSLYLFHEAECTERMGSARLAMAEQAGAEVIVTACPFCLVQIQDALVTTGRAERMQVVDLAELVARAAQIPAQESAPA